MEETSLQCPACQSELIIPNDLLGQVVRCPSCQRKLQLPDKPIVMAEGKQLTRLRTFKIDRRDLLLKTTKEDIILPHQEVESLKSADKKDKGIPNRKSLSLKKLQGKNEPVDKSLLLKKPNSES